MFTLNAPVWEFMARGVIVYFALMLLIRISGKRSVGEFTPFDMVVVILLAECTQGALTGGDESVLGALIVCTTLVGLNFAIGFLSTRFALVDRLVEGEPVVLMRNGTVFENALRRNNLPASELEEALRHAGISAHTDVELAVLETDGKISVITKR